MGAGLRHTVDRFGAILLIIPVIILVWADASGVALSQATYVVLAAYFVVVSGVNISHWAKQASALARAVSRAQRALDQVAPEDDEEEGAR